MNKVKIELFWEVHPKALAFSFTERPFVWTILKHCLSFLYAFMFCHKSLRNSPIKLLHHHTKIPFWDCACDNHFSRKQMCAFDGIRNTLVKSTDCVVLPWVRNDEWIGKRARSKDPSRHALRPRSADVSCFFYKFIDTERVAIDWNIDRWWRLHWFYFKLA